MSRKAGEAARRAAEIIKQRGWHRNGWQSLNGAVCIRGAFNVATYGTAIECPSQEEEEFTEWMTSIGVLAPDDPDLAWWNDRSDRTKEEVLAYLDKFAEEQDPQPVLP